MALVALALFANGCGSKYGIGVTTYLSHSLDFPAPGPDVTVAVVAESEPDEPLLEDEVQRKIETLVAQHGYGIASIDEADYVLSAFFAIDSGNTESGTRSVYSPGGVSTTHVYTSTGQWATGTTYHPGTTSYVPYSYTFFTRFLGINLYKRQRWLASAEEDLSDAIVWRASTTSAGSSSDLRSVIDYLLVATFREFGKDTGKRKRVSLRGGDKCVQALREKAI